MDYQIDMVPNLVLEEWILRPWIGTSDAELPGPAYRCEPRPESNPSMRGQLSEATAGTSVCPVGAGPPEPLREGPAFVQGVRWVIPLAGRSSVSGSIPPPETGRHRRQ